MQPGPLERTNVSARREVAASQALVTLAATAAMLDAHTSPGQYCWLRTSGAAAPFALYSAPHERTLAFLIGAGGDHGKLVYALAAGDALECSTPRGKGFDLARARGRDLVLVATGTGIAPIRALLVTAMRDRASFGALRLLYGVRDRSYVAFADELASFERQGVAVTIHESSPRTERRYVQHVLADSGIDLSKAAVFAAGQPEMMRAVTEGVAALGGDPAWVLGNL